MVDIHAHILPGLDDGAGSMGEALKIASIAVNQGISHMAATSHGNYYPYTIEEYWDELQKLQKELEKEKISLKLYPGMEIFVDEDIWESLEQKQLLTLNHTNYLLVEFPFEENPEVVISSLARLKQRGYWCILAHPERYLFMQRDEELAWYLADQGCVLQINAGSLLGSFGRKSEQLAKQMLDSGIISVIATDTHDTDIRPPHMKVLVKQLQKNYPDSYVRLWMSENPSRILKGLPVIQ